MNDKEKIEKARGLIEEMLAVCERKDEEHKQEAVARGKGEQAIGDSWEVFYLNMLLKILKDGEL